MTVVGDVRERVVWPTERSRPGDWEPRLYFNSTPEFGISSYFYTIHEKQVHVLYILYLSKMTNTRTGISIFLLFNPIDNRIFGSVMNLSYWEQRLYHIHNGWRRANYLYLYRNTSSKPQFIIWFLNTIHWKICGWGKD